ncbi:hypothetical protein GMDG_00701 [Pseudogymnoascus destructans 20631-21]|uniref:Uncharacterized protein n=1 Tax=Pseudogymnoascus destructans (strain ATCC MYA-4855 / 20631-21) TaxID=658429 RepID=L8G9H7_PSED2|nr:hypothetical protein GMDG_00701 [Pseudogymnoascus destructans 20631-21]
MRCVRPKRRNNLFTNEQVNFKKQYRLCYPKYMKQIFWRLFVCFPRFFFRGYCLLNFKIRFRGAFSNIQEASFSKGILVFKMRLDGVGVVQWQSLVWLSKLGRVLFSGCESALPRAPWHTIHLSVGRYTETKSNKTPKLLYPSVEIINYFLAARLCLASFVPPPVPNLRDILQADNPQLFSAHVESRRGSNDDVKRDSSLRTLWGASFTFGMTIIAL